MEEIQLGEVELEVVGANGVRGLPGRIQGRGEPGPPALPSPFPFKVFDAMAGE